MLNGKQEELNHLLEQSFEIAAQSMADGDLQERMARAVHHVYASAPQGIIRDLLACAGGDPTPSIGEMGHSVPTGVCLGLLAGMSFVELRRLEDCEWPGLGVLR